MVGTFAGQADETPEALSRQRANIVVGNLPASGEPRTGLHPLGGFLASWAGVLAPDLKTTVPVDLEQLLADTGRMVFLINWDTRPAGVELTLPLSRIPRQIREITTDQPLAGVSNPVRIAAEVPAQGIRVYRIDY